MNTRTPLIAALIAAAFAAPAFAQSTAPIANEVQRNVNQQQRIEKGLQSGALNTREAARLERGEAAIARMEARAARDGGINAHERSRITAAQNRESQAIYNQKHDAQLGNPTSASSQRIQADVQRDLNQQQRIEKGLQTGQLTTREAASLERGQARVDRAEARAGRDGRINANEQRHLQAREDRQSHRIFHKRHNAHHA